MTCSEIWGIVISIISAIATLAAVIVALWQTKYSNKKKLKLSFTTKALMIQDMATLQFAKNANLLLSVSVVNIGNRKVVLTDWGFQFDKINALQIVNINEKVFPCELEIECAKELQTDLLGVRKALIQNKDLIKNNKKKLIVYVTDSTGRKYYVKMPHSIKYYSSLKEENLSLDI